MRRRHKPRQTTKSEEAKENACNESNVRVDNKEQENHFVKKDREFKLERMCSRLG